MSTPITPPKKKRTPRKYVFNNRSFNSVNALLNHLISINLLKVEDRISTCQYCGVTVHPNFIINHIASKHPEKISLKDK